MPEDADTTRSHLLDTLARRRARALAMGGDEAVARQHERGKLTARERIGLLFDPGTFTELGLLAHRGGDGESERTPADGVITGDGLVDGRRVLCAAYDFTVLAGSMGSVGEQKVARLRQRADAYGLPLVWLLDSAGARIQEAFGSSFAASGALFYEQVQLSGCVPLVAAVMGPCAAGTAYIPGLADFVPMVRDTSSMALAGARLVRAATGEETTDHAMGGSQVHCVVSGCADLETDDDAACIAAVREYLGFFPSNSREQPPIAPSSDPPDRALDEAAAIVPGNSRQAYDMRRLLRAIVDDGHLFEIKPAFARNVITTLARLDGQPVGLVASQPMVKAGVLDVDASDKAARFITLCDAFSIPLVFIQDVPGFVVGTEAERQGIIRHGAKLLYATSAATVPRLTLVVRKAYGAGYYALCGRAFGADLVLAWPSAEISVMGPEGAVEILHGKRLAEASDASAERSTLLDQVRGAIDPYHAAGQALIDDVIDPRETRSALCRGLALARTRRTPPRWRRHGVPPV